MNHKLPAPNLPPIEPPVKVSIKVFIVIARRWGSKESHNYLVGVFFNQEKAKQIAESHTTWRGGKYACFVEKMSIDEFDNEVDTYSEVVYKSLSSFCTR